MVDSDGSQTDANFSPASSLLLNGATPAACGTGFLIDKGITAGSITPDDGDLYLSFPSPSLLAPP